LVRLKWPPQHTMHSEHASKAVAVFDLGGTWFRWGLYDSARSLQKYGREPAINYLSRPHLSASELQTALADFIIRRVGELRQLGQYDVRIVSVSIGAPVNAHNMMVLGSGPLWGPAARPFNLHTRLSEAVPELTWHVVNDITALIARYIDDGASCTKTMLITVSSGIGSRLYDHRAGRIPYDATYGVQGEIGHLVTPFELDGKLLNTQCECGGWNHMNAFSSGRGIAQVLRNLPTLSSNCYSTLFTDPPDLWQQAEDEKRLEAFQSQLRLGNEAAAGLLDALVTPLSRVISTALSLDSEIDRIVITGGVAHGLGQYYRDALQRTFMRNGVYQISACDPSYLLRRLHWESPDDYAGLRGAGILATR
jgi:2-epi-5-epi-valiolone 7-kinase